jgi:hypothetical protein
VDVEKTVAAIAKGPHRLTLQQETMAHLQMEVTEKEGKGAVWVVLQEDLKNKPPKQVKVSLIAMIPHKSRMYRAVSDLSYIL